MTSTRLIRPKENWNVLLDEPFREIHIVATLDGAAQSETFCATNLPEARAPTHHHEPSPQLLFCMNVYDYLIQSRLQILAERTFRASGSNPVHSQKASTCQMERDIGSFQKQYSQTCIITVAIGSRL
jgi:hypothetical protein